MPLYDQTSRFDQPHARMEAWIAQIEKVMIGKRASVELAVVGMLCGGHLLLEDVPGVGKTMLVRALAKTVDASFKRIQCTSDLLPSDVTGISVYHPQTGQFSYRPGPIMAQLVLADEMNRASPRTQSALLEAMEEKQVTVDGETHLLPHPFVLIATQNPVEHEGAYPLPEAQLDRFMLKLHIGYPSQTEEAAMLSRMQQRHPIADVEAVLTVEQWRMMQEEVKQVAVDDALRPYIVRLVAETRQHRDVALGASPRASFALMRTAQAYAWLSGRHYIVPDDVKRLAVPTIAHRLVLHSDARYTGKTAASIVQDIVAAVPVPVAARAAGGPG